MHEQKIKKAFDISDNEKMSISEKDALYNGILKDGRKKSFVRNILRFSSVAAVLLLAIGSYYFLNSDHELSLETIAKHNQELFVDNDNIQIASLTAINSINRISVLDTSNISQSINSANSENDFSTLFVPYGKRLDFVLPDGSTVWLNAGSYLTFKTNMNLGDREVYLNGEGFFDIKKTGQKFIVRTSKTNIEVLGTSFNAYNYDQEGVFSLDLITGQVLLKSKSKLFKPISMKMKERVTIDYVGNGLPKISKFIGGDDILWTKKQLSLKNIKLKELLARLERVYNVKIIADKGLLDDDLSYMGRLDIGTDILTSLYGIYELKDYEIKLVEKEVLIEKK